MRERGRVTANGSEEDRLSSVDVIIPTRALAERGPYIERAIESVLSQENVRAVPLLVVNGDEFDSAVMRRLLDHRYIRVSQIALASLPAALGTGRRLVSSPWFAELDDDDVLLPGALSHRLDVLEQRNADVIVSSGIIRGGGEERTSIEDVDSIAADPLAALAHQAWLDPGAALFRTEAIPLEFFDDVPAYLEWTYIAAKLAARYRLAFTSHSTYVRHTDTPRGVWGSEICELGQPGALQHILTLGLPPLLRTLYERRLTNAQNAVAGIHLRSGRLRDAWRSHLQCLRGAGGWRYLPYTRRLLRAWIASLAARS